MWKWGEERVGGGVVRMQGRSGGFIGIAWGLDAAGRGGDEGAGEVG